jgi:hypothetical protein
MKFNGIQTALVVVASAFLVAGAGIILVRNNTPWTKSMESPMKK